MYVSMARQDTLHPFQAISVFSKKEVSRASTVNVSMMRPVARVSITSDRPLVRGAMEVGVSARNRSEVLTINREGGQEHVEEILT